MALSYLIGGGTLDGVKEINNHQTMNNSITPSFSFNSSSSSSSSYAPDNTNSALTLRRLGLSSEEFARRLTLEAQDHYDHFTELDASRNQISDIPDSLLQSTFILLTHLNLSYNNLAGVPSALLRLSHLQQLNLSENHIELIPVDMPSCLSHLFVLALDSNQLQTLPDTVNQWHELRELRLGSEYGGNRITQLPNLSEMHHLIELDVSFNQIDTIAPHTFDDLHSLTYLNLSHNQLRHMPTLESCEQLVTLDLSDNQLTEIPLEDIWRLTKLQLLNISNNLIEALPMELLDHSLQTQVVIKGNPVASHENQYQQHDEDEDTNPMEESSRSPSRRRMLQMTTVTSHFSPASHTTNELLTSTDQDTHMSLSPQDMSNDNNTPILLHSLQEIALRALSLNHKKNTENVVPEHIAEGIRNQSQRCIQCSDPFVHEWITSLQQRSYRGYASVVQQVRFCGTRCWLEYKESLRQQVLALQSQVTHPAQQREESLQYITRHPQAMDPSSVDWILAAAMASSIQQEQADILANYHMYF